MVFIIGVINKMQNNSAVANGQDSLDQVSEQYYRSKSQYSRQSEEGPVRSDLMLKNLYKQQLDQIMAQKNEQKKLQKEREMRQREQYNQRISYGREAERLKDLSYKNYYQMLLNNQSNIAKNHIGLNYERDNLKEQLIQHSIQQGEVKNQQWFEAEQRRLDNMKRSYREELAGQVNQKYYRDAQENQSRVKMQEEFKKVTLTPQEVAKHERERKLMEMSKYKEDLDRTNSRGGEKYRVMNGSNIVSNGAIGLGSGTKNDFNIHQQVRHDPMVNPVPFNIQNPYILREFRRREQPQPNYSTNPITQQRRN